ncbi:beta-hexosaminidase [Striga asiatica]|uniref:Beta-hexosaminidase n=1 Tax=Striga asiatica TaxID=4170 RepID=A0A5A7QXV8_STRAF|nr:beta-hexosaminidase [Striga asiatica]
MHCCHAEYQLRLVMEEDFWKQKAAVRWVAEGGRNTRFFQGYVRQKRAKSYIHSIEADGSSLTQEAHIRESAVAHFQTLFTSDRGAFGPPDDGVLRAVRSNSETSEVTAIFSSGEMAGLPLGFLLLAENQENENELNKVVSSAVPIVPSPPTVEKSVDVNNVSVLEKMDLDVRSDQGGLTTLVNMHVQQCHDPLPALKKPKTFVRINRNQVSEGKEESSIPIPVSNSKDMAQHLKIAGETKGQELHMEMHAWLDGDWM